MLKLTQIEVLGFLGARDVHIKLTHPVCLIAGSNAAGKSSVRDAVALALTADLSRVSLKKDAAHLVHAGSRGAAVRISTDTEEYGVEITADGKITDKAKGRETHPLLPFVLDARRFARQSDTERRSMLFGLMKVSTNSEAVRQLLERRSHAQPLIDTVAPMLRSGFPAAHTEAQARARDAKAAWKAITNETWGARKGADWSAVVPDEPIATAKEIERLRTELVAAESTVHDLIARGAAAAAHAEGRMRAEGHLADLDKRGTPELIDRLAKKLAHDEAELAESAQLVAEMDSTAKAYMATLCDCPACGVTLEVQGGGKSLQRAADTGQPLQNLPVEAFEGPLNAARKAHELMQSAVRNAKRDLDAAISAAEQAKALRATLAEPAAVAESAPADQISAARKSEAQVRADLREKETAIQSHQRAVEATAKARGYHEAVAAWDALADDLAPEGIQAQLLANAIGPFNLELQHHADMAEWGQIMVQPDMSLTKDGRPYALLSESEQWRVDAVCAAALSRLGLLDLLCLDRFDVLDIEARGQLLGWLGDAAWADEFKTVLLFGTLKGEPTVLPEGVQAVWLDQGVSRDVVLSVAAAA